MVVPIWPLFQSHEAIAEGAKSFTTREFLFVSVFSIPSMGYTGSRLPASGPQFADAPWVLLSVGLPHVEKLQRVAVHPLLLYTEEIGEGVVDGSLYVSLLVSPAVVRPAVMAHPFKLNPLSRVRAGIVAAGAGNSRY